MLTTGISTLLGCDDLLSAFACGCAFAWDGYFNKATEDAVFSNVIDLLFNCAAFIYIGANIPFKHFNDHELGVSHVHRPSDISSTPGDSLSSPSSFSSSGGCPSCLLVINSCRISKHYARLLSLGGSAPWVWEPSSSRLWPNTACQRERKKRTLLRWTICEIR